MKRTARQAVTWRERGNGWWVSTTGCNAYVGTPDTEGEWHVSVSHPLRYPTWDELATAREAMTPPGLQMCIIFPPLDQYVNAHETCFHLWEHHDAD